MHGDRTAGDPALQQGDARMHAWIWAKLECAMGSAGSTLQCRSLGDLCVSSLLQTCLTAVHMTSQDTPASASLART